MAKLEEILPLVRKGRRFRHKNEPSKKWIGIDGGMMLDITDLVSDDFELEPIKKEISRDMLAQAWDEVIKPKFHASDLQDAVEFLHFCERVGL